MNYKKLVKRLLNDPNNNMAYHDATHMAISKLPRIRMCGHMVSGIHGVTIPEFGTQDLVAEYDGWLDERRVAIHQFLTQATLISTIKFIYVCGWLACKGGNPLTITIAHYKSMNK